MTIHALSIASFHSAVHRASTSLLLGMVLLIGACSDGGGDSGGNTVSPSPTPPPAATFTLTTTISGSGTVTSSPAGINCGATCSAGYASGTGVALAAAAATGYTFSGWSGACSGTGACTVSMTAARSVTATFSRNSVVDTTSPTVSLTAPSNGVIVSGPAVTVSANATDNVGVAGVQFKLDGASLGAEDTTPPYSISWNTSSASNGTHTLTATARDAAGNQATSIGTSITVSNPTPDTTPPSIPAGLSATAVSSSRVNLAWTASTDNVGVAGYRLYRDSVQIGTSTATSFADATTSASTTYSYQVAAYDAAGNVSALSTAASATTPAGGGAGSYDSTDALYDALYDNAMGSLSAAKWVAMDGSDSAAGTQAAPYATIGKALSMISGGGAVIVKDGTYTVGANGWLNDRGAPGSIPSGTAGAYTIIKAQNRFGARLVQNSANYYGSVVQLEHAQFVWLDGFVIEKGSNGAEYAVELGRNNRLTRCVIVQKRSDNYGGAVAYGSNNVIEDVHAYGWGRYVFYGGTGGGSSPAGSTVLRRCVSYLAGGPIQQPTASFAFYGSNDGAYAQVKDVLFANSYEIDSPALERGDPNGTKWGAWYHPKSVRNVLHHGCGIINGGAHYGGFRTDNFGGPSADMAEYRDSFVAGLTNGGTPAAFSMSSGNGINDGSNVTVCNAPGGTQSGGVSLTNILSSGVIYPVQRVGANGAEQRYAVGAFLSKFGDSGYATPQPNMPLWPFPYESYIKREFSVAIPKPSGFYPAAVTQTSNPFAGTSLSGHPMTFTRRVWEACGNVTPDFNTIY